MDQLLALQLLIEIVLFEFGFEESKNGHFQKRLLEHYFRVVHDVVSQAIHKVLVLFLLYFFVD